MMPTTATEAPAKGLRFDRWFSTEGQDPYESVQWKYEQAVIKDETGNEIFRQDNVEIPRGYTEVAKNVVVSKYFYGDPNKTRPDGSPEREWSVRQLVHRVARTITDWGHEGGYFATREDGEQFHDELVILLVQQYAAFNSPVWFNVGLWHQYGIEGSSRAWRWDRKQGRVVKLEIGEAYRYPQGSACFIQSVDDDMVGIMALATSEAMLFKYGSGTGTDLSTLRSCREKVNGGGSASGPVSFMGIYDAIAATVKSGGKCLAPHQPVFTAGGVKTARELAEAGEDFTVLSYSRRLGRVAARRARAWKSGSKEVWSLRTDKGEFHLSADHPIMLATGRFVELEDLKPGMSLMASRTYAHPMGYVSVSLTPTGGYRNLELLHRLVAVDILGWDIAGKVVHHDGDDKTNSEPARLALLPNQAAHATMHNNRLVAEGRHVFQQRKFDHSGETNGMHSSSAFWQDENRVAAYREKQGTILKESGRAGDMQAAARRVRMLNTGYSLINAGHDIATFEGYVTARKAVGRRCPSVPGQLKKFEREFGSYAAFHEELRNGNHEVVEVRKLGYMDVYDVEVDDPTADTGADWDEHNFAIRPLDQVGQDGTSIYVHNTRRAAKMQSLKVRHPDILEFIVAKTEEEKKAQTLVRGGYSKNFNAAAYSSVKFQNCNMSVRATDEFLALADSGGSEDLNWQTYRITDGMPDGMPAYNASQLLDGIAEGTWICGDPGLQYEDTIQRWHTCPHTAPINASNPCSEYMFIDDSACNLASLNLMKFRVHGGRFDVTGFRKASRVMITAQEIIVDNASYPTEKIALNSHLYRPLGLGYCNLGALIMAMGLPYDSDEGRDTASAITAILTGQGYLTSAHHAANLGPFEGFAANRWSMLNVMHLHRGAIESRTTRCDPELRLEAQHVWDSAIEAGERWGYRNSQISVLAPTGTISFMMGADTSGIEPDIALVKYKQLAGGGTLALVNGTVGLALETLGYDEVARDRIMAHLKERSTIEGAPGLSPEHLPVFDCSFTPVGGTRSIAFGGHLRMLGAAQPFVSGAISKTCNLPRGATVADIRQAYLDGWRLGAKAVAIYRDGSKESQPVTTSLVGDAGLLAETARAALAASTAEVTELKAQLTDLEERLKGRAAPHRRHLPDTRRSLTHKFHIEGIEGYITVGLFPDGTPGELFITMAKEGSTVGGLMDVIGTLTSMGLQYGVPLEVFVNKFAHSRFEPSGYTHNSDLPIAKSLADYIFRWLGITFLPDYRAANVPQRNPEPEPQPKPPTAVPLPLAYEALGMASGNGNGHANGSAIPFPLAHAAREPRPGRATIQLTGPMCPACNMIMVPSGARCFKCENCGNPGPCG